MAEPMPFRIIQEKKTGKAKRVYGKGELTADEDARLRKVIALIQQFESLKRDRRGFSAAKGDLSLSANQYRSALVEYDRTAHKIHKTVPQPRENNPAAR
jgi:hypothetical protein